MHALPVGLRESELSFYLSLAAACKRLSDGGEEEVEEVNAVMRQE
jgi:hypothetical protein